MSADLFRKSLTDTSQNKGVASYLSNGSTWQRWEPHIHGPGTVLNDQFEADDDLERYLTALEQATPTIKALGITDYYTTDVYEAVVKAKDGGRLSDCELIFPNVEMRLDAATPKGKWVNLHLLVSPEDPKHLEELHRVLSRLTFEAHSDTFSCVRKDLIRLGMRTDPKIKDERTALSIGATQFKVNLALLREVFRSNEWAQKNILIAVAGNSGDGTSAMREASDLTLRQEVEKFADIIFASSPAQRDFWLGLKDVSVEGIETRFNNLKPCLHGSDAHDFKRIAAVENDRFSWIKGAAQFDSLRQACIEPAGRAYIGSSPPMSAPPSRVIESIEIDNAAWALNPKIKLNSGLVAIIGSRGSGKTALAELIAAGCDAVTDEDNKKSFLQRAQSELVGSKVNIKWASSEEPIVRNLDDPIARLFTIPMARYLSQQFVDELCSSDGVSDKLLKEVERVIFNAHEYNQKDGTTSFEALLELKASRPRAKRFREEELLNDLCERIGVEIDKSKLIADVTKQVIDKEKVILQYTADRATLVSKDSDAKAKRLNLLTEAANKVRGYLWNFSRQDQALQGLKDDVKNIREVQAPDNHRNLRAKHNFAGLEANQWEPFKTAFAGNVDVVIDEKLSKVQSDSRAWKGNPVPIPAPGTALIGDDADLSTIPLTVLEAEIERLNKEISEDQNVRIKYRGLTDKITQEQSALGALKEKLVDYKGSLDRLKFLNASRDECYNRALTALLEEEEVLQTLYYPMMAKLEGASGTLGKMAFSVKRTADVKAWADAGEELIDLRLGGPLKGTGTLQLIAQEMLQPAWEKGTVVEIVTAMEKFRERTQASLLDMSKVSKHDAVNFQRWARQFAKWLYSTDHIKINYNVEYDGIDIRRLSPGTRGIVLLLLYLALDDDDDSPLIIDQPEENLDPKSVYDELVTLFMAAKHRRQVIIVTHNANLVVNTDADQVIIARLDGRLESGMPKISYLSGGLEEKHIREEVCGILEGGRRAFQERARKLRVSI